MIKMNNDYRFITMILRDAASRNVGTISLILLQMKCDIIALHLSKGLILVNSCLAVFCAKILLGVTRHI